MHEITGRPWAAILLLMLLPVASQAGGHKVIKPAPKVDVDPAVETAVIEVIHATADRWNSQDYATVLELWDPDEPFPFYLAEEQPQWFVGWERLREYLDPPRPNPVVEAIREEMYDIKVKQIAPDLAIAIWQMHFEMKTIGSNPIGEEVRVSASCAIPTTAGVISTGRNHRRPRWYISRTCTRKTSSRAGTSGSRAHRNARRRRGAENATPLGDTRRFAVQSGR